MAPSGMKLFREWTASFKVNLPNLNGGDTINSLLTFEDYLMAIKSQIMQWSIEEFVIVAHSIGGCRALKIAEEFKASWSKSNKFQIQ